MLQKSAVDWACKRAIVLAVVLTEKRCKLGLREESVVNVTEKRSSCGYRIEKSCSYSNREEI